MTTGISTPTLWAKEGPRMITKLSLLVSFLMTLIVLVLTVGVVLITLVGCVTSPIPRALPLASEASFIGPLLPGYGPAPRARSYADYGPPFAPQIGYGYGPYGNNMLQSWGPFGGFGGWGGPVPGTRGAKGK